MLSAGVEATQSAAGSRSSCPAGSAGPGAALDAVGLPGCQGILMTLIHLAFLGTALIPPVCMYSQVYPFTDAESCSCSC